MEDFTTINVKQLREDAQTDEMDKAFAMGDSVNLDEVDQGSVSVAFTEFTPYEVEGPGGKKITKNRLEIRHAEISMYVPMFLLTRLLADQKKMQKLQKKIAAGEIEEPENDPTMDWITHQVLNVWKLTEEDMTYQRLERGLNFEQMYGLFSRFFGPVLKRMRTRV